HRGALGARRLLVHAHAHVVGIEDRHGRKWASLLHEAEDLAVKAQSGFEVGHVDADVDLGPCGRLGVFVLHDAAFQPERRSSRAYEASIPCSMPVANMALRVSALGSDMRMVISVPVPSASKVVTT